MIIAISLSTFALTLLLMNQLGSRLSRRQRQLEERLKTAIENSPTRTEIKQKPKNRSKQLKLGASLNGLVRTILSRRRLDKLQVSLIKAGIPVKAEEILGITLVSMIACVCVGIILFNNIFLIIILGTIGLLLPIIWVNQSKKIRSKKMEGQLLDAIVLLANSLRAGHSFIQSMELVSKDTPSPLADEFRKVIKETHLGIPLEEALVNLTGRVESSDLEMVVTGVLIQRQVGGNLAEVLDTTAGTIEKRIKARAKIRALTAQGRLSAWIVSLLPVCLAAFIFGSYPEFGRVMLHDPVGLGMLGVGVILLIMGIFVIRKVVNIDV